MIVTAGEALIDMVADRDSEHNFCASPGGAAYNVACALGLLDISAGFICPISRDNLGDTLLTKLLAHGVEPILKERVNAPTPLALVSIDSHSQAHYSFYQEGTAERMLSAFTLDDVVPSQTTIFHISGYCLNRSADYHQWMQLVESAKKKGAVISVDPNVRAALVHNEKDYRRNIKQLFEKANIVKVSDEDLDFLYHDMTHNQAKQALQKIAPLSIITYGKNGAEAYCNNNRVKVDAHRGKQLVDTVGAGDCFSAAYLYRLYVDKITNNQLASLPVEWLQSTLEFAAIAAAINCGRKGCQPATINEIEQYSRQAG